MAMKTSRAAAMTATTMIPCDGTVMQTWTAIYTMTSSVVVTTVTMTTRGAG
jgi:hypothetical protein